MKSNDCPVITALVRCNEYNRKAMKSFKDPRLDEQSDYEGKDD